MTRSTRPFALVATAVLVVLSFAACNKDTTKIKDILDDPARFTGTVRIEGDVKESVGVLGTGAYEVDDGTGSIVVVAQTTGVPRQGAHVGVEGTVKPGFTLGTRTLTVIMEEKRVTP
jgi:hypothetical protein